MLQLSRVGAPRLYCFVVVVVAVVVVVVVVVRTCVLHTSVCPVARTHANELNGLVPAHQPLRLD